MQPEALEIAAAKELLRRRRGRASLLGYVNAIEVPGKPVDEGADEDAWIFKPVETSLAAHHLILLQAIERAAAKRFGRFMVFMPPGSAKSTYTSVVAPTYFMGKNPGTKIILASYGSDLARKMGRRARQIVKSKKFESLFGAAISPDSAAANEWALTNGSEYLAAGLRAGLTGNRAHGALIDDPIKGRADANSKTVRDSTWDAYVDDLQTRLVPGGWVGLVQTRWHEDDIAGRLLPQNYDGRSGLIRCTDGRDWEVINIPAQCESENDPLGRKIGDYIWPEWFDASHWDAFKTNPRTWASLFQQRPAPQDGDIFRPDMIGTIDAIPWGVSQWVRGWDLGATAHGGDYTVGVKLGRLADGRVIVADVVRGQFGVDQRDAIMKATADADGVNVMQSIPQDPGQAGKSQVATFARLLAGSWTKFSTETGDKVVRANPFASQVNVGNVVMLRADWNKEFKEELRVFDSGTHDDQVDAASRAYSEMVTPGGAVYL